MHIAVTAPNKIIIIDKVQNNTMRFSDGRPVSTLEYDLDTGSRRILPLTSNTFCSSGGFIANGTLVSTGGAEEIPRDKYVAGFSSLRFINPCQDDKCHWREDLNGMTTHRWYPSSITLSDGRLFILGGSQFSVAINNLTINNPTYEIYPSDDRSPKHFQFLVDTLPFNLFPIIHLMPGPKNQTYLFVFANKDSIIFDWKAEKVIKKLPRLKGASRTYPTTGSSVMLPLRPEDDYKPIVLICGGNEKNDPKSTAANTCGRIDLSDLDKAKWEIFDFGGLPRAMPNSVILADGKVLFLNGVSKGIAGYNSMKHHTLKADDPVLTPVLYNDQQPNGKRFQKLNPSTIPRVYHSVATLIPNGKVFIAGSSPQQNVILTGVKFPTELRVELFSPPYLSSNQSRVTIESVNGSKKINKGPIEVNYDQSIEVEVTISDKEPEFTAALLHYGFVTHSTHMSQRYVSCIIKNIKPNDKGFILDVVMPPHGNIMPPIPVYLHINNKGIPCMSAVHLHLKE
ncbi:18012_t:CDS:2 [Dentiscutata erythropus]|uniref:18012_t:CDS:1 n=1 Tax=Dentiscutata erythropus TaxID=1348616 RepID=A0A9N9FYZ3_9GLOM|nr:18012_t:CDS:2 [Dentiscutata erythropus]